MSYNSKRRMLKIESLGHPPFELFYLMIFPLPNMYDMWVRSII